MTLRRGGRPRGGAGRSDESQAHPLVGEHGGPAEAPEWERRSAFDRGRSYRVGQRQNGRSGGGGVGGALRFILFALILAVVVLGTSLTVLRPLVKGAIVGWAADNPTALGLPLVADLVKEDLGSALTDPAGNDPTQIEFVVQPGDTASSIADRLAGQQLLKDPRAFVFIAIQRKLTDKLEAGTFILRKDMTPDQLVTALLEAKELAVTIQLREGLRLEQVVAKLETLPLKMDVSAFYDLVKHPPAPLLADYPWIKIPKGASLEGFLAPATYKVLADTTPDELVRKMLDHFYETVGVDRMNVPKERGMTFYQILTLASIVEREAVVDDERATIAGVYQNRLDKKPRILNADPAIFYALDTVALSKLPLDQWTTYSFWSPPGVGLSSVELPKELEGYQTYQVGGLIPGPICTPTVASIDAALQPDTKDGYYYFVAIPDGSGRHAFAKTFAEHQANLKKYGYR